jgi:hypothetical protein
MSMAVTSTQQGVVTEAEFAKIAILTSDGKLVPARPLADDDRRDFEIHIRQHFLESIATQLKTSRVLRRHGRSRVLQINFRVAAPLVTDKRLWYFLAHFDVKAMRFSDPVFLVPSDYFHRHAKHGVRRGKIQMQFKASMEPGTRDMWSRWALPQAQLGSRILEILEDLGDSAALSRQASHLISLPGVVWLGQPGRSRSMRRRRAA